MGGRVHALSRDVDPVPRHALTVRRSGAAGPSCCTASAVDWYRPATELDDRSRLGARRPSAFSHAPGASVGLLVLDEPTKAGPSQALYAQPAQPGSSRPSAGRGTVRWRVWSVRVAPGRARGAAMLLARATAFGGCLPVAAEAGEVQCAVCPCVWCCWRVTAAALLRAALATWPGERRPGDARSRGPGPMGRGVVAQTVKEFARDDAPSRQAMPLTQRPRCGRGAWSVVEAMYRGGAPQPSACLE